MDIVFIARDALASSIVGTLLAAVEAKEEGLDVGVIFTQEALAAATGGSFIWPRELSGPEMRYPLADRGKALGLPLMGRSESRQLDAKGLIARARDKGVTLYACPWWSALLGIGEQGPVGFKTVDRKGALTLLREAKQVIGTL
ncbi:MAG: hypothetical protein HY684_00975 [Chloroflexi bacterium]|nr:hypothetical protein [Chloroflexota bacterium]